MSVSVTPPPVTRRAQNVRAIRGGCQHIGLFGYEIDLRIEAHAGVVADDSCGAPGVRTVGLPLKYAPTLER